jgi:hypothetical protein
MRSLILKLGDAIKDRFVLLSRERPRRIRIHIYTRDVSDRSVTMELINAAITAVCEQWDWPQPPPTSIRYY